MRTTIRPLTVIFSLSMLAAFGAVPYFLFFKKQLTEINVATVTAAVMTILFLLGIFSIAWLTLFIRIDQTIQKITFTYPLRLQKITFDFKDMIGFRYKYLTGKVDYKAIQFKTKDGRKFTVSDFETANLRELETLALETLELRSTDKFLSLDEEEKEREIKSSRNFDVTQAKHIRDMLIIGIFFFIVIIVMTIIKNNGPLSTGKILFYLVTIGILISMIKKLIRTIETVKNGA